MVGEQGGSFPPRMGERERNFPSIGREDLTPGGGLGGGMFVGPDHALFNGRDSGFLGPLPRNPLAPGFGPGLPQPRYDPIGPIVDGNDFFDPETLPRPGNHGQRGRMLGEPNPDHFKPPGW